MYRPRATLCIRIGRECCGQGAIGSTASAFNCKNRRAGIIDCRDPTLRRRSDDDEKLVVQALSGAWRPGSTVLQGVGAGTFYLTQTPRIGTEDAFTHASATSRVSGRAWERDG